MDMKTMRALESILPMDDFEMAMALYDMIHQVEGDWYRLTVGDYVFEARKIPVTEAYTGLWELSPPQNGRGITARTKTEAFARLLDIAVNNLRHAVFLYRLEQRIPDRT